MATYNVEKTPLWRAAEDGDTDRCRELLSDNTLDVDASFKQWTPLMKAAENGFFDIVDK